MHLIELTCRHFRCLKDIRFVPSKGVNIIQGRNAQGKTSLLEALFYAATSKSHRTNREGDLTAHGEDGFHVEAQVERNDRHVTVEANAWKSERRFKVNGVAQTRVSDVLGKISVVLFTPEDIALVKGAASVRRTFLDMELSQLNTEYLHALQHYRRVLRQRNELLRLRSASGDQLDAWDVQLHLHGSILIKQRADFLADLAVHAREVYGAITNGEELSLAYKPDILEGDSFADTLTKCRASDVKRGVSTRGPHRDDIELQITERGARTFGSQGQQKSAALAIKLAHLDLITRTIGEPPILLLDEVLAELDSQRATALFQALPSNVQCLVTTATQSPESARTWKKASFFRIEQGEMSTVSVEADAS